jgi:uncharacterized SAM-binding protein YcdF (DUF218 family)
MKLAELLVRFLSRPLETRDSFARADAIVVLGSPLRRDGTLTPVLEERVRAGVELWRRGGAPVVCFTGGKNRWAMHDETEADAMAAHAQELGLPLEAILVEREARYTMENAIKSAALLAGRRDLWLVTTPFHLRRARLWFRRLGFTTRGLYMEDSVQFARPGRALRWVTKEYLSLLRDLVTRM